MDFAVQMSDNSARKLMINMLNKLPNGCDGSEALYQKGGVYLKQSRGKTSIVDTVSKVFYFYDVDSALYEFYKSSDSVNILNDVEMPNVEDLTSYKKLYDSNSVGESITDSELDTLVKTNKVRW